MPTLLEIQRAFGAGVLIGDNGIAEWIAADGIAPADRLRIYRNTIDSVLAEALRLTYPAVDRLVGREFFDMAAARFARERPPCAAYLSEYGGGFPDFLAALPEASGVPYLADTARFEWALDVAANAPDVPTLDFTALAAVAPEQHAALSFVPHPSLQLLHSGHPVDEIADAVLSGDERAMAAVDPASGPVWLVVHRGPTGIEARRFEPEAWRFTEQLAAGESLGMLVGPDPDPQAAGWLAEHLARARFAGFRLGSPRTAPNAGQETSP